MDSYNTIEPIENILFKDTGSKFIGFAYAVNSEQELKQKLEHVRQIHPKATHHCYAYRLGLDRNNFRSNDDGEPNGSAGKPILGQIDFFGITNCLVIIVRYFGGTKLGVGGLISAYKETAKLTLNNTTLLEKKILRYYQLECSYNSANLVYQLIHQYGANLIEQTLDNHSNFIISIAQKNTENLEMELRESRISYSIIESK